MNVSSYIAKGYENIPPFRAPKKQSQISKRQKPMQTSLPKRIMKKTAISGPCKTKPNKPNACPPSVWWACPPSVWRACPPSVWRIRGKINCPPAISRKQPDKHCSAQILRGCCSSRGSALLQRVFRLSRTFIKLIKAS